MMNPSYLLLFESNVTFLPVDTAILAGSKSIVLYPEHVAI